MLTHIKTMKMKIKNNEIKSSEKIKTRTDFLGRT